MLRTKQEIIRQLYDTHYHLAMQGDVESSQFLLELIEQYPHLLLKRTYEEDVESEYSKSPVSFTEEDDVEF